MQYTKLDHFSSTVLYGSEITDSYQTATFARDNASDHTAETEGVCGSGFILAVI